VLLNLINNAHKFTPKGGTIQVAMSRKNGYVLTQVKDDGRGIPDEDQQHIFSEYYRGSNADGQEGAGTGLGLAIARSLVRMDGGEIWFESKVGEGTTFSFTVPVARSTHNEPDPGLYVLPDGVDAFNDSAQSSDGGESRTAPNIPSSAEETRASPQ
jgi:signal transduction histidine kinase